MHVAALIVAAGRGERAAGTVPKQYALLGGRSMLWRSVEAFSRHPDIRSIAIAIGPGHERLYDASGCAELPKILGTVAGGATRQASVLAGLEALAPYAPDAVLIHDAARPFVSADVIGRVIEELAGEASAALAALPVADTLKRADSGHVSATVSRDGLWIAQTPQGFRYPDILAAHRRARDEARSDFTDDAAVAEWAGIPVRLVMGSARNTKVTTNEELAAVQLSFDAGAARDTRTGFGFDVHRFAAGDHVWLCGVSIPHTRRLEGHSDADVCLHALTDALLGTIAAGDIGDHFPPSDARWKGAPSRLFLEHAARCVAERGGRIVNVDITVLAEAPKIGPHRDRMRQSVAEVLSIDVGRVGLKATTMERLGFIGRDEGIAAMATVAVSLPAGP